MLHNYKSSFFSSLLILLFCTFNIYAQLEGELIPFSQTYPGPNDPSVIRGDMKVIGNSILGILDTVEDENGVDRTYTPNESYFGFSRNNGVYRGYIDIDSDASFNSVFSELPNSERNYSGIVNLYGSPTDSSFSDTGTFSSSAAELTISNPLSPVGENCLKVVKAYLYWGAMYRRESTASNDNDGDNIERPDCIRPNGDACEFYTDIKILPPGASAYVDIKYDNSGVDHNSLKSEVIIDGIDGRVYSFSETERVRDEIYACVADVTSLFTHLQDNDDTIEGNWTVANVRALTGTKSSGSGGGWSLVVVYQDPLAAFQKNISMFEGYAAITRPSDSDSASLEFNISGFQTSSSGPVYIDIASISLEGDIGIYGDQFQINDENDDHTKSENWVSTTYPGSDPNNFYDSSIYSKGPITRFPNSSNTLGYDCDHFSILNPDNEYVSNNDNEADFRIYTEGDAFANFFNAFAIEVASPKLQVINKEYKNDGSEFEENAKINLGDEIHHEITVTNTGNVNLTNIIFEDLLPANTILSYSSITIDGEAIPNNDISITDTTAIDILTGVSLNTKLISFNIPDELLQIGESVVINFSINVVPNCSSLQVCSSSLQNQTNVSYYQQFNEEEQFHVIGTPYSNGCFITDYSPLILSIDQTECNIIQDNISIAMCTENIELQAGTGFAEYHWFYNGTPLTINADGTPISSSDKTIVVDQSGTYTVNQIKSTSVNYLKCMDLLTTFNVELFDPTYPHNNPFIELGEPLDPVCSDDGTTITEILLCDNSSLEIIPNFQDATIYSWQKYDETLGCTQNSENCPYYSPSVFNCYTEVSDSPTYNLTDEGAYKLSVVFTEGCQFDYFFEASENCPTLSTNENELNIEAISVYPSPVINDLVISNKSFISFNNIKIVTLKGETLIQKNKPNSQITIDLSNLNTGLYLVIFEHNEKVITKKVLKK